MPGSVQHTDHAVGGGAPLPGGGSGGLDEAVAAYQAVEQFLAQNITLFAPPQMADQTNFDVTKTSVGKSEEQNQVG